jgi:hypothetical protein
MAKKRTAGSELGLSGSSPAAAHTRRRHSAIPQNDNPPAEISVPTDRLPTPTLKAADKTVTARHAPKFDEIARLAYSYWETRGYQGGSAEEDWRRAEEKLKSQA